MFLEPTSYKGEKHCVTVVLGEPIPRKTLVSVPVIQEGQLCRTQREARNVDIFEVVQMFALVIYFKTLFLLLSKLIILLFILTRCSHYNTQLDISFSVITPTVHPIFRAIFNLVILMSHICHSSTYIFILWAFHGVNSHPSLKHLIT